MWPFTIRTVESIEREEICPGYWKCSVLYQEAIHLPGGIELLEERRIQVIYFTIPLYPLV
jgi:hypothetical protein